MDSTTIELSSAGAGRRHESMRRALATATSTDFGGSTALASPKLRTLICPFCGSLTSDTGRCHDCHARFDPLSRQASQNEMGPWFVRDQSMPYRPGCNYSTIKKLVEGGSIEQNSVIRGPGTRQFWMLAKHTPGVAQLFGVCHHCGAEVAKDAFGCSACGESFSVDRDRQHLGLGAARAISGRLPDEIENIHAAPPEGVERVAGPAAIPVGHAETRSGTLGRRASDVGLAPGQQTDQSGDAALDAVRRVDELTRMVRTLRRAWQVERKRSWIALGCAGLITAISLVIVLVT
ncbi:MAG: hypothetical protein JJ974_08080 [Phycisphaerales bacterium]|nr:hypothetical protein [Phycisphaerales bacterium]